MRGEVDDGTDDEASFIDVITVPTGASADLVRTTFFPQLTLMSHVMMWMIVLFRSSLHGAERMLKPTRN